LDRDYKQYNTKHITTTYYNKNQKKTGSFRTIRIIVTIFTIKYNNIT